MKRSLLILLAALALGAALFAGAYFAAHRASELCCARPADDLNWLQLEFHLSNAELARIRELHEGYLPQCAERCARIAEKKRELDALLGSGTNVTGVPVKQAEIAALRAECQSNMLAHFVAVSQAMPPAQGERYLAEMKKFTLGAHEKIEQSMSGDCVHEHAH